MRLETENLAVEESLLTGEPLVYLKPEPGDADGEEVYLQPLFGHRRLRVVELGVHLELDELREEYDRMQR